MNHLGHKFVNCESWGDKFVTFESWGDKFVTFESWGDKFVTFESWGDKFVHYWFVFEPKAANSVKGSHICDPTVHFSAKISSYFSIICNLIC